IFGKVCGVIVRRLLIGIVILLFLVAGAGYTWTFTPSYSLYRIRQALQEHDYATFSRYVDVESVLDHAFEELAQRKGPDAEGQEPRSPLGKVFRKGLLKEFASEARDVMKAGVSIMVEQAVRNREQPLPEIPAEAVVAAFWFGQKEGDTVTFPVKVKKG